MSIDYKALANPYLQGFADSVSDPDYKGPNIRAENKVSIGPELSR